MNLIGNVWADFFARLGSESHAVSDTVVKCQAAMLKNTELTLDVLSRFPQAIAGVARELSAPSAVPVRPTPERQSKDLLALMNHTLLH